MRLRTFAILPSHPPRGRGGARGNRGGGGALRPSRGGPAYLRLNGPEDVSESPVYLHLNAPENVFDGAVAAGAHKSISLGDGGPELIDEFAAEQGASAMEPRLDCLLGEAETLAGFEGAQLL